MGSEPPCPRAFTCKKCSNEGGWNRSHGRQVISRSAAKFPHLLFSSLHPVMIILPGHARDQGKVGMWGGEYVGRRCESQCRAGTSLPLHQTLPGSPPRVRLGQLGPRRKTVPVWDRAIPSFAAAQTRQFQWFDSQQDRTDPAERPRRSLTESFPTKSRVCFVSCACLVHVSWPPFSLWRTREYNVAQTRDQQTSGFHNAIRLHNPFICRQTHPLPNHLGRLTHYRTEPTVDSKCR